MLKELNEVLSYTNDEVVKSFRQFHPWFTGNQEDADLVFDDLKRFLWLYAKLEQDKLKDPEKNIADIGISESMIVIDNMWHTFILFTQDYTDFCQENFGGYLHHPFPSKKYFTNVEKIGPEAATETFVSELVECVYEHFGPEISVRWFETYFKFLPPDSVVSEHHATAQS